MPIAISLYGQGPNEILQMELLFVRFWTWKIIKLYQLQWMTYLDSHGLWPNKNADSNSTIQAVLHYAFSIRSTDWLVLYFEAHFISELMRHLAAKPHIIQYFTAPCLPWGYEIVERVCAELFESYLSLTSNWRVSSLQRRLVNDCIHLLLNRSPG